MLTSFNGLSGGADEADSGAGASVDANPAADGDTAFLSTSEDSGSEPDSLAAIADASRPDTSAGGDPKESGPPDMDSSADGADVGASPIDSGSSHVDACVPTTLACDGKAHACNGVIDEGCPSGLSIGSPGEAEYLGGSNGGSSFTTPCPSGQVLVGIGGSTGQWIDAVYAICGTLDLHATTSSTPYSYSVTIGGGATLTTEGTVGTSDTLWQANCPSNEAVVSVAGNSGVGMDHLTLSCAPLEITGSPGAFALHQGTVTTIAPEGDTGGGGPFTPVVCPDPQVVSLISGMAGEWVYNMSVACATPKLSLVP